VRGLVLTVLAVTLVLAAPAAAAPTRGFSATGGKVRCAIGLPQLPGLLCAATGIAHGQYDHRRIVRLLPSGRVSLMRSGSDLLLAIDGNRDDTPRPALTPGRTWRAAGFTCQNRAGSVTCRRAGHGFTVSATRSRRF
jgi:hypothetical protein